MTAGLLAGSLAPLLMWAMLLTFGARTRGYDLILDPASELGSAGSAAAALFNAGFFVLPGIGIMAFAASMYSISGNRWTGRSAALLLGVAGMSVSVSGLIPMDGADSFRTILHRAAGVPLLTALPGSLLLLWGTLPRLPQWRWPRRCSLLAGLLLLLMGLSYQVLGSGAPVGLIQRLSMLALTIWLPIMGWGLHNGPQESGPHGPDRREPASLASWVGHVKRGA